MAAYTISNPSDGFPEVSQIITAIAGEDLTNGKVVAYDKGQTDNNLYLVTIADADRRLMAGIALEDVLLGNPFAMLVRGWFLGTQNAPGSAIAQASGNFVFTANAGGMQDAIATNCHRIGMVYHYGESGSNQYAILVEPEFTLGV